MASDDAHPKRSICRVHSYLMVSRMAGGPGMCPTCVALGAAEAIGTVAAAMTPESRMQFLADVQAVIAEELQRCASIDAARETPPANDTIGEPQGNA